MRRRDALSLIGGAAATATLPFGVARAQATPVVGFLNTASAAPYANLVRAFHDGLAETGFVEGRNVTIEYRWAEGNNEKLKAMVAELVRRRVNVIAATGGSTGAIEAKAATSSIPIVFQVGVDPVRIGLVASLNRPGGNVTGATMLAADLGPKRLELLRELVPTASSFAALVNPTGPSGKNQIRDIERAAQTLKLKVQIVEAGSQAEFEDAFQKLRGFSADALLISGDPLFNGLSAQLAELTLRYRIPAVYQFREFVAAGGLMSYGGSITDAYAQAGRYTGRVLKGDAPADLPVQQSTKIELFVNVKTARTLSIAVPQTLLASADEIIE